MRDRLHPETTPGRVPFGVVKHVDQAVELSVPKDVLGMSGFEDWVRDQLIARIPGSAPRACGWRRYAATPTTSTW